MKIRIHLLGVLAKYANENSIELDLPGKPLLKDALEIIQTRHQSQLPFALVDSAKDRIHPNLFIRGKERDFQILDDPLSEGEEIYLLIPMAGG